MISKLCIVTVVALFGTAEEPTDYSVTAISTPVAAGGAESTCAAIMEGHREEQRLYNGATHTTGSWTLSNKRAVRSVDVYLDGGEDGAF